MVEIATFAANILILKEGLVIKSTGSWFTVESDNGEQFDCKIKGNFRIKGIKSTNPVAVGDRVKFSVQAGSGSQSQNAVGLISAIEELSDTLPGGKE